MGCDIHSMIERRAVKPHPREDPNLNEEDAYWGWWINSGDPDIDRCYELFEILAGVRGSPQRAISKPRGIPSDATPQMKAWYFAWKEDAHSASYVTLAEIASYTNSPAFKEVSEYTKGEIKKIIKEMRRHMKGMPTIEGIGGRRIKDENTVRLVFFFDN